MSYDATKDDLSIKSEAIGFIFEFNRIAFFLHQNAYDKGFRSITEDQRPFSVDIALIHSELSEALEGDRHGDPPDDKIPEFTSREAELADAVIRIIETAKEHKLRLAEAIVAKHNFNRTRPHKHGKQF